MNFILPLIFGFMSASIGIALPGLINMTAAKVSMRDGHERALFFISGAVVIIFFQTYLAILFARFIDSRPDVIVLLREIGFLLFLLLTIYFLFIAKKPKIKKEQLNVRSKTSLFFIGMLLSTLNLFPIPYYVFVTVSLASFDVFSFEKWRVFLFLFGVVLGSFSVFYYYISFFKRIENKADYILKNMNYIIGTITGLIALVTLITIVNYYIR